MAEYLTTRELASLLRIKERKVYDLAASGEVPCTKVTGKLLFPEADVRTWLSNGRVSAPGTSSRAAPLAMAASTPSLARKAVFLGSHDPLLDWSLRESRCGLPTYFDSSLDGLQRFVDGEGIATGLHVYHPHGQNWNVGCIGDRQDVVDAVLVHFARRQRGLIVRRELTIRGLDDLPKLRLVPRQKESGSHTLLSHLLQQSGIDWEMLETAPMARSEADAVLSVSEGQADVAFGLAALATQHRLPFVPLIEEAFDLLIDRRAYFETPIQTLLAFFGTDTFQQRADSLTGYDIGQIGTVRWNA